jgi:hypothetical protein
VTIDSPRTQGLIGFEHDEAKSVSNFAADIENRFCSLLLTAMDQQPIASSSRLLLIAGGPVENTGQVWNTAGTDVTNWGTSPTLIDAVKGTITLRNLRGVRAVSVQAIDGAGQPLGAPEQGRAIGDDWAITLGDRVTTWYEIQVER